MPGTTLNKSRPGAPAKTNQSSVGWQLLFLGLNLDEESVDGREFLQLGVTGLVGRGPHICDIIT